MQADPVGTKYDLSLYAFVAHDPVNAIDPSGEAVERIVKGQIEGKDTSVNIQPAAERASRKSTVAIVVHRTVSDTASSAINSAESSDGKASFHIVIDKDGATTQIANLNKGANHVGKPSGDVNNDNSIGIEVVGNYDDKTKTWDALTPEQVESTAQAIHVIAKKYGVDRDKVLPHESVSAKTAGEGGEVLKSVKDRLDEIWKKREK